MSVSIIQKLAASFTDTSLPKLYRDPTIDVGAKYCFDFTNSYCNPQADGLLPANAVLNNLVDNAASATATVGATNARFTNAAGKAGLVCGGSGLVGSIPFGAAGVYDRSVLNHEFLFIAWMKTVSTGYATSYPSVLFQGPGGNRNSEQFWMDMGPDGLTPSLVLSDASNNQNAASATVTAGSVFQFAAHWTPGVSMESFLNGNRVALSTTNILSTLRSGAAYQMGLIAPGLLGTLYRVYEEDMFLTKAAFPAVTAAQLVAADYATFNGKFA